MTPIAEAPRPLLTASEVAALLNVSVKTVRRYEAAGTLRPVRLSRRALRYRVADVEALMAPQPQTAGVSTERVRDRDGGANEMPGGRAKGAATR
jgi:excisionase family DNA binding protein